MGCGVSKEDISEPHPMRSHGRSRKFQFTSEDALKPSIRETYASNSNVSSLQVPSSVFNYPPPTAVFSTTQDEDTSNVENESNLDPSFSFPYKLSVEEVKDNTTSTTALSALSDEREAKNSKTVEKDNSNEDVDERIESIITHDEALSTARIQNCSTCPLGTLSEAAILQDLRNTSPMLMQNNYDGDFPLAGEVSGAEMTCLLKSTCEKEVYQSHHEQKLRGIQESEDSQELAEPNEPAEPNISQHVELADEDSAPFFTDNSERDMKYTQNEQLRRQDQVPDDSAHANEIWPGSEFRKAKLPPLTIISSTFIEIPTNPFTRPALPTATKYGLLETKVPTVWKTEKYEDHLAGADTKAPESADSMNGDNSNESSPMTGDSEGTPSPATKSPTPCEQGRLHCHLPYSDIEDTVLLEPDELNTLSLLPMLDCHSIHTDEEDFIIRSHAHVPWSVDTSLHKNWKMA